ncbi:unnamed protein product [Prorocentrum cordatum]|uniref:PPIase FKBP-type domain-containing protein n=1 Tax=Prorocentrum cordatum TaxID=2364126 RepID=A0ABN9TVK9_9DINO|nr:unnamed protein product [Polarella glacialis]
MATAARARILALHGYPGTIGCRAGVDPLAALRAGLERRTVSPQTSWPPWRRTRRRTARVLPGSPATSSRWRSRRNTTDCDRLPKARKHLAAAVRLTGWIEGLGVKFTEFNESQNMETVLGTDPHLVGLHQGMEGMCVGEKRTISQEVRGGACLVGQGCVARRWQASEHLQKDGHQR